MPQNYYGVIDGKLIMGDIPFGNNSLLIGGTTNIAYLPLTGIFWTQSLITFPMSTEVSSNLSQNRRDEFLSQKVIKELIQNLKDGRSNFFNSK